MRITNAYQAQLARLGGNTDITVQPPVNKYEKLLGDIEAGGGSGGGSGSFIVEITWINDHAEANKTLDEIIEAAQAGQQVVAHICGSDPTYYRVAPLCQVSTATSDLMVGFQTAIMIDSGSEGFFIDVAVEPSGVYIRTYNVKYSS